jgi:hypothetical protein
MSAAAYRAVGSPDRVLVGLLPVEGKMALLLANLGGILQNLGLRFLENQSFVVWEKATE